MPAWDQRAVRRRARDATPTAQRWQYTREKEIRGACDQSIWLGLVARSEGDRNGQTDAAGDEGVLARGEMRGHRAGGEAAVDGDVPRSDAEPVEFGAGGRQQV